jgi:hypothetical protein
VENNMMLVPSSVVGFLRAGLVLGLCGAFMLACAGKSDDEDGDDEADCTSLCEAAQSCPGAEPDTDCASQCRDAEELVDSYGCAAEFERYFSCIAELSDICSLSEGDCDTQAGALSACLSGEPPSTCTEGTTRNATCTAVCERAASCSDPSTDCAASCADLEQQAAVAGCTNELQDYVDCVSTCDDACAVTAYDCPSSFDAFTSCMAL